MYHQLIVWQIGLVVVKFHVNFTYHVKIAQLWGWFNIIVGHVCDIHVTLYGIANIFHAISLIYHVQDSFSVTIFVLLPVHAFSHVEFRANGNSASQLLSLHDNVNIIDQPVHQLSNIHVQLWVISHIGSVLSILFTQVERIFSLIFPIIDSTLIQD